MKTPQDTEVKGTVCSICFKVYTGFGNNAEPINSGRCCDDCSEQVIKVRIAQTI